ncbi:hypothetical protein TrST_g10293 [Triparma strigata]|uniref:WW domain-containing protein n=1 Tax=Triparma strigata TaxID=1606541 RepID=A0A9W7ESE9_9STRA|nr:hypothetical protein TrST_g10293 [Triparma strigata]
MERASDVFFLDVSALRKLRPGKQSSRFDHSITTSDLVKQAPLISSLKELVDEENDAIRKGASPEKATKMVRSIENELDTAKEATKQHIRKMHRLQKDLAKAEVLEANLKSELKNNKKVGRFKAVVKSMNVFQGDRGKVDERKRTVEIKEVAKAVGMKIKDAAEMYDRTHVLGNFRGEEGYEFGVDEFVLEVFDRINEDPQNAKNILLSYHRTLDCHEVANLMKIASVGSSSPSTSPTTSPSMSPGREEGREIFLDRMFRALVVMRRLQLLAQVEGGVGNARRNWRQSVDAGEDAGDDASTTHYSVMSKASLGGGSRKGLPPVKVTTKNPLDSDRETPRILRKDVTGLQAPPSIDDLRQELQQSSSILHNLDRAMKRDVALVSQNYTVKSEQAKRMSWVWGLEKLESVGRKTLLNYKWLAFRRMLRYDRFQQNCQHAALFMKTVNARIIGRICVTWLHRKFVDMFEDWKRRAKYETELEEHSAVLEMQATVRRVFATKRVQILREHRAATNIQRVHRGNGGRQMAEARREYLKMKWAACVIETAWINLQVIRAAKKVVRDRKLAAAARVIQGMWRARVAKRRVTLLKEHRRKEQNCLKIQCLWRGYTTRCEVYSDVRKNKRILAATKIQNMVRMYLAFWVVEDVREKHAAATSIQTIFRGQEGKRAVRLKIKHKAATEITRLCRGVLCRERIARKRRWIAAQFNREARSTIKLQNAFRMRQAVKKAKLRKEQVESKRRESVMLLQRVIRGKAGRVNFAMKKAFKLKTVEEEEKLRRSSVMIQSNIRRRQAALFAAEEKAKKEKSNLDASASKVQSLFRGNLGRRKSSLVKEEYDRMIEERTYGLYYSLQRKYIREQEKLHGEQARMIQANIRIYLAKKRVGKARGDKNAKLEEEQMNFAACLIQNKSRSRNAQKELSKRKQDKVQKLAQLEREMEEQKVREEQEANGAATMLQRQLRGRGARKRVGMMKEEKESNLAATRLQSVQRRRIAKGEVQKRKFEVAEKRRIEEEENREKNICATRLQALYRGNNCRENSVDLLDELKRVKEHKDSLILFKAVVRLQCGWRKNRAKKHFKKRQKLAEIERKQREEDEELERNLEVLHKEQEMLLYVLRLQNCYRNRKARKIFDIARIAHLKMGEVNREKRRQRAVLTLQSWARGMKSRTWFKLNVHNLRQELEYRSWCVECVSVIATRRCTTCLDRYCNDCWNVIHRKGRKRQHGYDIIEYKPHVDEKKVDMFATNGFNEGSSLGGTGSSMVSSGGQEWIEYWDESAGAKYWYNKTTGEASWIRPS